MKILFSFILFFCCFQSCFSQDNIQNSVKKTYELINFQRKIHNLNILLWNEKLFEAAKNHSTWMAKVGKMTHVQGDFPSSFQEFLVSNHHPVNRIIKSGYHSLDDIYDISYNENKVNVNSKKNINDLWGEVIAHGKGTGNYPLRADVAVDGWMKSPGHKLQILNPNFKEVGIFIFATRNQTYWCVVFGSRRN